MTAHESIRVARPLVLADLIGVWVTDSRHRPQPHAKEPIWESRITADLQEMGSRVSENTVAAVTAEQHLVAPGEGDVST